MKEKIRVFTRKNLKLIIVFACIIGFIAIAEDVFDKEIIGADMLGYKIISTYLMTNTTIEVAKIITNLGSAICLIAISVLILIIIKNKKIGIAVFLNLAIATILNLLLKSILQRPRPTEFRLIDERGYSFPSGHSMISMAFYGFIIYLIYKYVKNKYIKWTFITVLSILIIVIGTSRILLGVHYTSDVIAGFLIAISYMIVYIGIVKKIILERE